MNSLKHRVTSSGGLKIWLICGVATCLLVVASGRIAPAADAPTKPDPKPDAEWEKVVAGNNALACDLFGKLHSQPGNLCFSPLSISTALAMTYAGARGGTATEMAKSLHFGANDDTFHAACGRMLRSVPASSQQGKQQWIVANALWAQQGKPFTPKYLKRVTGSYGAVAERIDFQNPESARNTINAWIASKTQDRIKDLLGPDAVQRDTRLVLTNAIYFKSPWAQPFFPKRTEAKPFTGQDGTQIKVPMMYLHRHLLYGRLADAQGVALPFLGHELSMVVLLPNAVDGLSALEKRLSPTLLAEFDSSLKHRTVNLSLPKFKVRSTLPLKEVLQSLGMKQAFTSTADFSGMDGSPLLFLQSVTHQAMVDVHEQGTEAAAGTAIMAPARNGDPEKPVTLTADHPFLFFMREDRTKNILLMGRVEKP